MIFLTGSRSMRFLFCLCMALVLSSFLSSVRASAYAGYTKNAPTQQPTLQVTVGFDDDSRLDYWTPAWITLSNDGPDFSGVLSATTYNSTLPSGLKVTGTLPWSYNQPITLPHGTQKQININVPFYENPSLPRGVVATLSDNHGKVIDTQIARPFTLSPGSLLIGILSDLSPQSAGFSPLSTVALPDPTRSIELATLNASTLPEMAEVLDNFDVIVLDDFTTGTLNSAQLTALQTWVNQGGALIEIGGLQWQRTLAALPPQLLPVVIHGTGSLQAGTNLLPTGGPTIAEIGQQPASGALQKSTAISTATLPGQDDARLQALSNIETVLSSGTTPLIVQAHQGRGTICYLAFDPASGPLVNWPGTIALWKGLLMRTLGDLSLIPGTIPRYSNGPGQTILRGGLWQILQPGALFPVWGLIFLLLGYIIVIGPVRLLLVKRLRRPTWSWRIVLSSVVVFSLLSYGLAYYHKGSSINSISIIQLNQGGHFAHVTSFFSIFIPGQGDTRVDIPSRSLVQPVTGAPFQNDTRVSGSQDHTAFTVGQNETSINLPDIGTWTLHPIVSEEDENLHGGLLSHLALRDGSLAGTVTNTLATSLSDVYILMPHSFAYIGHLPAGQSQQVNVPIHSSSLTTGATLADQIARDSHLPVPYFPYASGSQPQNDFQRHLAILAALSGEGYSFFPCSGPCSTHAIVSGHVITTPPAFGVPKLKPSDGSDSLLVEGAPATLIGWTDQPTGAANNVTINGASPAGTHDNLVQIPLNIGLSGPLNLPPGLISGQVINAEGNEVQFIAPDVYTMDTGSVTFEFTLPDVDALKTKSITIAEPLSALPATLSGTGHVQLLLYNWSTSSWDAITLNDYSFTTASVRAYTNSDGHVLLQIVNQNASLGTFLFGKPSLGLSASS